MTKTFTDITHPNFRCTLGACPGIHRSEDGKTFVIIGERVVSEIADKAGPGEEAVEIPADLVLASLGVNDLVEAANSFIGEIEDTPLASCREIEGLTSFRVLRNIVDRIMTRGSVLNRIKGDGA